MDDEMSSAKEVAITYETLYELLRREKSREELQQLSTGFLQDVLSYLKEKQAIIDESANKADTFSLDEHEKTQVQLVNIRKIIRELYERREKKILDMALNKSRTKSTLIDTSNLLGQERYLYESIVSVLGSFRENVLQRVLNLQDPILSEGSVLIGQGASEEQVPQSEPAAQEESAAGNALKNVRFTKPVEQFVGEEGELYGPFQAEDTAQLPNILADILIRQGDAVEVSSE